MSRARRMIAFAVALVGLVAAPVALEGCKKPIDTAIVTANGAGAFLDRAEPTLAEAHRAAMFEAIESSSTREEAEQRVAAVHARYHRAHVAYRAAREAELAAMATIDAAEDAQRTGQAPALGKVVVALAALERARAEFTAAVQDLAGGAR